MYENQLYPRELNVTFARMSMQQMSLFDDGKGSFYLDVFENSVRLKSDKIYIWVFGDCHLDQDLRVIFGRLGRYKREEIKAIFDENKRSFRIDKREGMAVYSNFVIDLNKNIIAFEYSSAIRPTAFINRFQKIFKDLGASIRLNMIPRKENDFFEFMETHNVKKVSMKIVPVNPHMKKEFKALQEEIVSTNSSTLELTYKNPEGNISADDHTYLRAAGEMEKDGYADISANTHEDEGGAAYYSRRNFIRAKIKSLPDDIKDITVKFLDLINSFFG